jgi:cytochrome c oxidase subunit 4
MSQQHGDSLRTYLAVFGALMMFTAITVGVAFLDLGVMNNVVALGIATIKATLVLLYFMHVRGSSSLTKLAIASGIVFFAILVVFTLSDTFTRQLLGTVRPL